MSQNIPTHRVFITNTNLSMLFIETVPVYYDSNEIHVYCVGQNAQFECHSKLYLQLLPALKG
jgi:hypothetical protein